MQYLCYYHKNICSISISGPVTKVRTQCSYPLLFHQKLGIKSPHLGLPRWCSGKESTCRIRGHRFNPWSRNTPQEEAQVSPGTTTTGPVLSSREPQLRSPRAQDPHSATRKACSEKPARLNEGSPRSPRERSTHSDGDLGRSKTSQ